jgi:hypothetical protein
MFSSFTRSLAKVAHENPSRLQILFCYEYTSTQDMPSPKAEMYQKKARMVGDFPEVRHSLVRNRTYFVMKVGVFARRCRLQLWSLPTAPPLLASPLVQKLLPPARCESPSINLQCEKPLN